MTTTQTSTKKNRNLNPSVRFTQENISISTSKPLTAFYFRVQSTVHTGITSGGLKHEARERLFLERPS
ncbi:MAG: hypothetical protein ACTSUQ_06820 [Candidatus Freyarchaeota archaeon]